jgi:RNA polymerase sigma-70 factor (ECF subfamily)
MTPQPPVPEDDDEIMRRLAAGQDEALAALMTRWQAAAYRFILRGVRDEGLAEELTQETFWRVWRARREYRPEARFSAWMFRIAAHLCLDHHRRRARRPVLLGEESAAQMPAPPGDQADSAAREAELILRLDAALALLPLRQRLAFEMNRLEEMNYRRIAESLGCSLGSVEQLIFRARRALREALADDLPGPPPPPPCKKNPDKG